MFCKNCGHELPEGATFCGECGTPVGADETQVVENGAAGAGSAERSDSRSRSRKPVIIAICVVAAVACAGVVVFLLVRQSQEKAAYDAAHAPQAVTFSITAPGYDASTDSPIPLHVEGTDLDGNAVSTDVYVASDGTGCELLRGTYSITEKASPLMASGQLYTVVPDPRVVTIDESGVHADNATFAFSAADPITITDDQISQAYDAAVASGFDQAKAAEYKSAVTDARKKAADDAAAAAAKAAEDAAAAQSLADRTYDSDFFSLVVPEAWGSDWTVSTTDWTGKNNGTIYFGELDYTFIGPSDGSGGRQSFWVRIADSTKSIDFDDTYEEDMGALSLSDSMHAYLCMSMFYDENNVDQPSDWYNEVKAHITLK